MKADARSRAYWRANLVLLACLLGVWFVVSFGLGILFAEDLDAYSLPGTGFRLGFWFAQQGSIYVFVVLVFAYVWGMNLIERHFGMREGEPGARDAGD